MNHPTRPYNCLDMIQNIVRILCTLYSCAAVWLFVLCSRLLDLHCQKIISKLAIDLAENPGESNGVRMWPNLKGFRLLVEANRTLHREFRAILVSNCFFSAITFLTSSSVIIDCFNLGTDYWIITIWDASDVLESILRLLLVCCSSDLIRSSVS